MHRHALCWRVPRRFVASLYDLIKEFKKTTTATATGTSLNKRFNELLKHYKSWSISSCSQQKTIYTKGMVSRETVSFVFPRVLMFPKKKSMETLGLGGKQN